MNIRRKKIIDFLQQKPPKTNQKKPPKKPQKTKHKHTV